MISKLSKIGWYWHRLWAMSPREVLLRVQKKGHQFADRNYSPPVGLGLEATGAFPLLPSKNRAPEPLLQALRTEAEEILRGQWKAFGHLPLTVSDPPKWQADNLVSRNLESDTVAFQLDHRGQPDGADIKVIWEPSRWYQLTRLALAGWLLDHTRAQEKCVEWLHDWASRNPPFTGLNWTSGLETGMRLIQYAWIDAFLTAAGVPHKTLHELRGRVLPPHAWYTWRYKSFGSSANNHLIGELAGLIVAQARWPGLAKISAPIAEIGALMNREILAQFAEDGGNREQALGYHLFSWEFCFQAQRALEQAGAPLEPAAVTRLQNAGHFYAAIKQESDPWDFGDSDNAWVTPLFAREEQAAREWHGWFTRSAASPALQYWWGDFKSTTPPTGAWTLFPQSGYAVFQTGDWFARLDFSPLGYLSMAPHGHLDALHLSVSHRGQPVIIDPGTGAYYADKAARNYLAGWSAHNSPQLKSPPRDYPKRFGTFLWGEQHAAPRCRQISPHAIEAELDLPYGRMKRTITFLPEKNALQVQDSFATPGEPAPMITRWKFAPGLNVERLSANEFRAGPVRLQVAAGWKMNRTYNPPEPLRNKTSPASEGLGSVPLESLASPAFRSIASAAYLALESDAPAPCALLISAG